MSSHIKFTKYSSVFYLLRVLNDLSICDISEYIELDRHGDDSIDYFLNNMHSIRLIRS